MILIFPLFSASALLLPFPFLKLPFSIPTFRPPEGGCPVSCLQGGGYHCHCPAHLSQAGGLTLFPFPFVSPFWAQTPAAADGEGGDGRGTWGEDRGLAEGIRAGAGWCWRYSPGGGAQEGTWELGGNRAGWGDGHLPHLSTRASTLVWLSPVCLVFRLHPACSALSLPSTHSSRTGLLT